MLGPGRQGLQPARRLASHSSFPRARDERKSKKQIKRSKKRKEKSIGTVRDRVLLGLLTNRGPLALRITRAASREIELRSQLDNFLAAPPVAFSGPFLPFLLFLLLCFCYIGAIRLVPWSDPATVPCIHLALAALCMQAQQSPQKE